MKWIKGFLINMQFFTAIPLHLELPMDSHHLRKAVQTFPLLGLFQGGVYSLLLFALIHWTPLSTVAVAFLLWLATILLTGGIHLDGWMDASDAYFSYQDKENRLKIMKDPRTGAFGAISLIVLLSSRFLFIYEVTASITPVVYVLIVLIPFLSKGVMGIILITVKAAKDEGLAAIFQKHTKNRDLWIYIIYFLVVLFVITIWLKAESLFLTSVLIIVAVGICFIIRHKVKKWFGGVTGDLLGASVEGTELILWMIVWLLHYSVMV